MHIGAHRGRSQRRTLLAVLFAVAALLIQTLLPAASLAAESGGGLRVELCTPEGGKTVVFDHGGQVHEGFAGLPCHDRLGAFLAVTTTPTLSVLAIAHVADRIVPAAPSARRAPPKPISTDIE